MLPERQDILRMKALLLGRKLTVRLIPKFENLNPAQRQRYIRRAAKRGTDPVSLLASDIAVVIEKIDQLVEMLDDMLECPSNMKFKRFERASHNVAKFMVDEGIALTTG
ncbi:MAG: hypothetical protein R3E02_01905 [Blastomonas sp.]